MMSTFTVTEYVAYVNDALASLDAMEVEGEVDEYKIIRDKWVVFKLKDEKSTIPCFTTVWKMRTQIEDGMLVKVLGTSKLRENGFYSFNVETIEPAGEGALKRAFELLMKKLKGEGLFSEERKRELPKFPENIALITSKDAAAYTDFIKVLTARMGGLNIYFVDSLVQGEKAADQLTEALSHVNSSLSQIDLIVMVRGGGSLEDLQSFNDENVVRAVAQSRLPIVVGVGHERDVTLAELACDKRASTPSNAAELIVKSREEVGLNIDRMVNIIKTAINDNLRVKEKNVQRAVDVLRARVAAVLETVIDLRHRLISLRERLIHDVRVKSERIVALRKQIYNHFDLRRKNLDERVGQLARIFKSLSPQQVLRRGYSITRLSSGVLVKSYKGVKPDDKLDITVGDGIIESEVIRSTARKHG